MKEKLLALNADTAGHGVDSASGLAYYITVDGQDRIWEDELAVARALSKDEEIAQKAKELYGKLMEWKRGWRP